MATYLTTWDQGIRKTLRRLTLMTQDTTTPLSPSNISKVSRTATSRLEMSQYHHSAAGLQYQILATTTCPGTVQKANFIKVLWQYTIMSMYNRSSESHAVKHSKVSTCPNSYLYYIIYYFGKYIMSRISLSSMGKARNNIVYQGRARNMQANCFLSELRGK